MGITIHWRLADDSGKAFKHGLSSEYRILLEEFGSILGAQDSHVRILRAMAKAANSKFYEEVADTVERVGPIRVWDSY